MSIRKHGSGGSTSESEARAAAASGVARADVGVAYSLPPDLLHAWSASGARPGLSLVGADLRPELMVSNVRAAVFPHLQQQIQGTIAMSLARHAWHDVARVERMHRWRCGDSKPTLRAVQACAEAGQEPRLGPHAPQVGADALPPVTRTEEVIGRWYSGNLFRAQSGAHAAAAAATVRSNPEDAAAANAASSSQAYSSAVVALAAPPVRFLSSERWLVQRCDGNALYRVQYFGQGDSFYAQVVPTSFVGLLKAGYLAAKREILGD